MPTDLLVRLEEWKSRFGSPDTKDLRRLLAATSRHRSRDASWLIRLHECLLFLRAYPADADVVRLADGILHSFAERVAGLPDLAPFEDAEVSGIAGTSFSAVFSYEVARQLAGRYPRDIEIDWENYEHTDKLGPVLRRFLPLVDEDWPVEAHVPFRKWVDAARPRKSSALGWMLWQIGALPLGERERADLYESLDLLLIWRIGQSRTSRSGMRLPVRKVFYHREPLLRRSDISLARELDAPRMPVSRLSRREARKMLDLILDTSAMRYRELYGFTHPDADLVFRAEAGRGVEIVFFGVPPEWRLPLRAYHAGMFFKNGVPAGYVEVLSLCERAEVGFNLYYTFREGESAWLYARLLRLFRQTLGVTCFSVDPYQIGWENDEALDSGAFWFYRKLGFRPLESEAAQLVEREERRMRQTPGYRSSRRTLEKLARSYLLYESADTEAGAWDRFRVRNLAIRCTAMHMDSEVLRSISRNWTPDEKTGVEAVILAKHGSDEARYLRLMRQHARLRAAIIKLGS
ncbi:MAG TPA: hypothetical protein VKR61_14775 [Bryobacteraceae bacterium]|nr:hypothetical protein [Bryobacteraceae bacterium]